MSLLQTLWVSIVQTFAIAACDLREVMDDKDLTVSSNRGNTVETAHWDKI